MCLACIRFVVLHSFCTTNADCWVVIVPVLEARRPDDGGETTALAVLSWEMSRSQLADPTFSQVFCVLEVDVLENVNVVD